MARFPEGCPRPQGSVLAVRFILDGQEFVAVKGIHGHASNEEARWFGPGAGQPFKLHKLIRFDPDARVQRKLRVLRDA
jgi:hypothetical protein